MGYRLGKGPAVDMAGPFFRKKSVNKMPTLSGPQGGRRP